MQVKIAVYTVLFGDADNLIPVNPLHKHEADFFLFTDLDIQLQDRKVVRIKEKDTTNRRMSRRYKISVQNYLEDYDYWIYIDASIEMLISPKTAIHKYLKDHDIAALKHPWRDCVYSEMKECLRLGVADWDLSHEQAKYYRRLRYPEHHGLSENGVLLRRNTPEVVKFNEFWQFVYDGYAERDQFSFNFCAWKLMINYKEIIDNIRSTDAKEFKYHPHLKTV